MSEKAVNVADIEISSEMKEAVELLVGSVAYGAVRASFAYLANNPVQFTDAEMMEIHDASVNGTPTGLANSCRRFSNELQRRLFLKREESLPDAVKALLPAGSQGMVLTATEAWAFAQKIYALGKEAKE